MKKVITLLLAFALILGMSQCKKNVETISSVPSGVYITLDVDGGDKVIVDPYYNPTYASVTFEQGDVIYVGNNGQYCGYLTHDGTKFAGNITPTSADDEDFLHFYFMGNKGPVGSAPSSVNIYHQTVKYPVISYGRSIQLYNSNTTNYSATLYNKCAIMKFEAAGVKNNEQFTIFGMNNIVTVDFSKNKGTTIGEPYTYSMRGEGDIILHTEANGERWAILLPQDKVTTAYAETHSLPGKRFLMSHTFTVPAVSANGYYADPVKVTIPSLFSVDDKGTKVRFSNGNLMYRASINKWCLTEYQIDYVGDDTLGLNTYEPIYGTPQSSNANISSTYNGYIDLFGWGTSGWNNGNTYYQPWSSDNSDGTLYGPKGNYSLTDAYANADWGVYDTISYGTDGRTLGRTLTIEEWQYLFERDNGTKYGHGVISSYGINGMILLPDDWTLPSTCSFTPGNNAYEVNSYTSQQWWDMEENGAIFLPAAGYRDGTSVNAVTSDGYYWSSSSKGDATAEAVYFNSGNLIVGTNYGRNRFYGFSVRLVEDMN